jgi:hypothetical protein
VSDKRMDDLLRTLPKERAGEGFTYRVVERLDQAPVKSRARLAVALVLLLLLSAVAGVFFFQQAEKAQLREEIASLRAEHRALSEELHRVMEQSAGIHPVLYLGGDDRRDYVLDVKKFVRERKPPPHMLPLKYTGGPI